MTSLTPTPQAHLPIVKPLQAKPKFGMALHTTKSWRSIPLLHKVKYYSICDSHNERVYHLEPKSLENKSLKSPENKSLKSKILMLKRRKSSPAKMITFIEISTTAHRQQACNPLTLLLNLVRRKSSKLLVAEYHPEEKKTAYRLNFKLPNGFILPDNQTVKNHLDSRVLQDCAELWEKLSSNM
ncbi:MAG: hypothetical protein VKJ06_06975 [Vampirovibrionales bacterium]|nr:hypothetical protein [Vampirovibrionales bacterium]